MEYCNHTVFIFIILLPVDKWLLWVISWRDLVLGFWDHKNIQHPQDMILHAYRKKGRRIIIIFSMSFTKIQATIQFKLCVASGESLFICFFFNSKTDICFIFLPLHLDLFISHNVMTNITSYNLLDIVMQFFEDCRIMFATCPTIIRDWNFPFSSERTINTVTAEDKLTDWGLLFRFFGFWPRLADLTKSEIGFWTFIPMLIYIF